MPYIFFFFIENRGFQVVFFSQYYVNQTTHPWCFKCWDHLHRISDGRFLVYSLLTLGKSSISTLQTSVRIKNTFLLWYTGNNRAPEWIFFDFVRSRRPWSLETVQLKKWRSSDFLFSWKQNQNKGGLTNDAFFFQIFLFCCTLFTMKLS